MIPTLQLGQFGRGSTDPFVGLLDSYSGAVVAYSVARKLKAAANNPYRIERASDSAQLDVTFASGDTNTGSAQSFIGSSTGGIRTLYDQAMFLSGSNGHLVATGTPLAQLINAGTLNTVGGKPAIVFAGSAGSGVLLTNDNSFGTNAGLSGNPAFSIFIVHRKTTNTGGCLFGWGATGTALHASGLYDDGTSGLYAFAGGNSYVTSVPTNNTQYLTTVIKTAGAINTTTNVYRNGSSVATSGHSTNTPNITGGAALFLGRWADYTSNQFLGSVQELIIFASDQSSNRTAIEANINAYYGIY